MRFTRNKVYPIIYLFCFNNIHRLIVDKPFPQRYVDRNVRSFQVISTGSSCSFPTSNGAVPSRSSLLLMHM